MVTKADSDPQIMLEISRDGGKTWGQPIYANIGQIGQYLTRARFQKLGNARDAIFRVTVTAAVPVRILSAMIDYEKGTN